MAETTSLEVELALDVMEGIILRQFPVMKAIVDNESEENFEKLLMCEDLGKLDSKGNTAVHWAVMKNKPKHLKMLLKHKAWLNSIDNEFVYPLHKAVDSGNEELVEILCQGGANVNVLDGAGQTALHYAVYCGSIPILETLLKYQANVQIADNKHKTALFLAVWKGGTDIVKLLLENNAKVDVTTEVNFYQDADIKGEMVTPLMFAAATGYVHGVELLLNFGADPHMRENTLKRSALFYATLFSHETCVDVILRESNIGKALIGASRTGDLNYVKLLLELKPNLECHNDLGETALTNAMKHFKKPLKKEPMEEDSDLSNDVEKEEENIAKLLLVAGACVDPKLGTNASKTPLMSAAYYRNEEAIEFLLDNGASVGRINGLKQTALWFAAEENDVKCLERLLKAGSPVNLASSSGTALMATSSPDCFKMLLQHDSEVNYRNDNGESAVTIASARYTADFIKLLIEHNAHINVVDGKGWSPVMIASSQKRHFVLDELLKNGAEINHADSTGLTALHIASKNDYHYVLEKLLDYKPNLNPVMKKFRGRIKHTPLSFALKRSSKRCVATLLKAGARAEIPDSKGLRTIMSRALKPKVIQVLHAAGADPHRLPDLVHNGDDSYRKIPQWQLRHQQPNYPTDVHDQDHDRTLFNICRLKIRDHLLKVQPQNLFHPVPLLPVPHLIKSSLLFDVELDSM